jgi:phosphohistidine swiveling domain-containing protein
LTLLTTPTDPSFAKRQELKFLSLIRTIQKDKELPEIFNLGDTKGIERNLQGRDILADIIEHAEEFGWIPFDYIGPDLWETEHFIDAISTFIKQGKDAENEIKRIEREDAILKERQLKAKQSLQIDDSTYRLFKDSRLLMLLQDMKKEISSKAHVWLQKRLLTEISNRTGIETRLLRNLTEKEFGELLSGKPMNIESLRERAERSVLVMENGEFSVLLGEEARDYERMFTISFEDLNEVKGTVASLGKAHGTARVLASAKEIGRVREGDILITTMTTPDYVPAMKKAAAIVTDEGGVTCHAAIVARELGIPCVIATRIATKIFKDGEEVEVDAVHGIVKKM